VIFVTYKEYHKALTEKRMWKTLGLHAMVVNRPDGWKVKVIGLVKSIKGASNHG